MLFLLCLGFGNSLFGVDIYTIDLLLYCCFGFLVDLCCAVGEMGGRGERPREGEGTWREAYKEVVNVEWKGDVLIWLSIFTLCRYLIWVLPWSRVFKRYAISWFWKGI